MLILFLFLRHKMNNNTRTIVVPSNEITFDKEAYDEDAMSPHISREEFNGIIDKINKIAIVAFFDSKKRKDHSIYKSTNLIILLNFIACILILFFVKNAEIPLFSFMAASIFALRLSNLP